MMQTCGAGSNWGSADSSTGQVCIHGKQASLVAACKRFIRPQVTCKLRKSTGGPCTCDVPWWSVYMGLPLAEIFEDQEGEEGEEDEEKESELKTHREKRQRIASAS